ncbi:phosphopantothenoylcysteine decarboxylase/phosphopantothenate--cysteine ligase [Methanolinea mesophila]|uniref:bifunctional phosphopantothenoylcysteine decarboxylase/phosphopantothenate--cysteine ligase CoaBC n=1 Tax=Methanolinea mesophila TaxID=547055 RepID=UPI001AE89AB8|nr:bifunctional phosphopantothenoylcysteine decarboxylase/phosphopantothenate--cysteine ligase CoaBC [Methanolinea mesophila]MBP1928060.1 phosphopantothenoylcysteine decarboxylase/phosphopantothenate--cysteine ligase [Methanolinea mesophila]
MNPGSPLEGHTIVLAVTGSIAAVETIRLAHALRRRGVTVAGVMSPAATGIIHPDALTYATGNETVTRISGKVEHVDYCGEGGTADLLLVAPCTANTLCKISAGIDDTPVTTFATTAIGRGMPVVIAPAMHQSMYRHPAVLDALEKLRSWGIVVISPRMEEGRAKIASIEEIVLRCERELLGKPLAGKKVLITSGACQEPVDDVRVLTTRSSGKMGRALALQAWRLGAEVTVVHRDLFPCVENVGCSSAVEMREAINSLCESRDFHYYISAAAVSDFAPARVHGKIPSGTPVSIALDPLPKILDEVIARYGIPSIGFKLGWDEEERAREMVEQGTLLVAVNSPEALGSENSSIILFSREDREFLCGTKEEVAAGIWDAVIRLRERGDRHS